MIFRKTKLILSFRRLAIKPTLRCTQFTKFEREYKNKIAEAEANIGQASREYEGVLIVNNKLHAEMDEMNGILNSGTVCSIKSRAQK